jgi:gluconolactonase
MATRPGTPMHSFLEGPVFDRAGALYCVDVAYGRIFRVDSTGDWEVFVQYDGAPHGLAWHRDGRLFIADHRHGILVMTGEERVPRPLIEGFADQPFKGVNDLVFAGNGDLYFTDSGWSSLADPSGRVFRLDAAGELQLLIDGLAYPNGLVTDLGETALLVAVTYANAVWRIPLAPGPVPPRASLFLQLSGGLGPDGLDLDRDGNLALAHARNGTVWLFAPSGEPLARIDVPSGTSVTSLAYGSSDLRTLFITEADSGAILTARLPVPGRPTFALS